MLKKEEIIKTIRKFKTKETDAYRKGFDAGLEKAIDILKSLSAGRPTG